MVVATIVLELMVVDNLYLMYTPLAYNCYCNSILFYIRKVLNLDKCYGGETAGDKIPVGKMKLEFLENPSSTLL